MRGGTTRIHWGRLAAALTGGVFLFGGCDPATKAAVEDGIINASSSLLGAFLQALIALAGEQQSGNTAQALVDSVIRFCA